MLAALVGLLALLSGATAAHAAYPSEAAYVCGSESQIFNGAPLSQRSILHPGCGNLLGLERFGEPAVQNFYRQFGFDRNFMLWAPRQVRGDLGARKHAGCVTPHANGTLCGLGTNNVGFGYAPQDDWNGPTTAKIWGDGFISLACGNFSQTGTRAGPVPSISGIKYEDLNGNGHRDGGEGGIGGVRIHLLRDGHEVASMNTAANGSYRFELNAEANAAFGPGTYTLREDVPIGYRQTAAPSAVAVGYGAADHTFGGHDFGNQKVTDIRVEKSASTPTVVAGRHVTWTIAVINDGHFATPDVRITDEVSPAVIAIDQLDSRCGVAGRTLTCEFGTLAPGARREITFRTLISPAEPDGPLTNSARGSSDWPDTNPGNDTGSVTIDVITRADLVASKSASPTSVSGGSTIVFDLGVRNNGPSVSRDVVITDVVPFQVEILDAPGCTVVGQTVRCVVGDLGPGQSANRTVSGKARGVPVGTDGHSHQLTVDKQDGYLAMDPHQTADLTVACPSGMIATDGSFHVETVDQGTGTLADVRVLRTQATSPSAYSFRVANGASGRAQGHGYVTCLGNATTGGDGNHQHTLVSADQPMTTQTLAVGRRTIDLPVDLDYTAIAPSYAIVSGAARLIGAEQTAQGWRLAFDVTADAQISASVRQLRNRTATASGHDHLLAFSHPARTAEVPPGSSELSLDCGELEKGLVATFDGPINGHEPRPRTRTFWFDNTAAGPVAAKIDLLCVGVVTSAPVEPPGLLTNTVEVDSATVDPSNANNSATVEFVIDAQAGSVPADPGGGPVVTFSAARVGPAAGAGPATTVESAAAIPVSEPKIAPARLLGAPRLVASGRRVVARVACVTRCRLDAVVRAANGRLLAKQSVVMAAGASAPVKLRLSAKETALLRRLGGTLTVTSRAEGEAIRARVKV
ncbi:MAG: DUF11 domain-containing protein [Thermoleophilaceae bacterium]|nr:DUF11 domain-containing protein [Thermoleophilaceae bacterium]